MKLVIQIAIGTFIGWLGMVAVAGFVVYKFQADAAVAQANASYATMQR